MGVRWPVSSRVCRRLTAPAGVPPGHWQRQAPAPCCPGSIDTVTGPAEPPQPLEGRRCSVPCTSPGSQGCGVPQRTPVANRSPEGVPTKSCARSPSGCVVRPPVMARQTTMTPGALIATATVVTARRARDASGSRWRRRGSMPGHDRRWSWVRRRPRLRGAPASRVVAHRPGRGGAGAQPARSPQVDELRDIDVVRRARRDRRTRRR